MKKVLSYIAPQNIVTMIMKYGIKCDERGLLCIERQNRDQIKERITKLKKKGLINLVEIVFITNEEIKEYDNLLIYPSRVLCKQILFIYDYGNNKLIYKRRNKYM